MFLIVLGLSYLPYKAQTKDLDTPEKTKVGEINIQIDKGSLLEFENEYISQPIYTEFEFNALGLSWQGGEQIFVKIIGKEKTADWMEVEILDRQGEQFFGDLIAAEKGLAFQYKILVTDELDNLKIKFTYINTEQGDLKLAAYNTSPKIISRAQWGADETWRYCKQWDSSKKECVEKDFAEDRWPVEYAAVKKIVIHHSAGSMGDYDPSAIVRAMYFWHAITLGWGDIGYNYIIDHLGNIYEGRSGGDGAVGGHAYYSYQNNDLKIKIGYNLNFGSVGIALLGDYTKNSVPEKAQQSLINLITLKSQKYDVKPDEFTPWPVPIIVKDLSENSEDDEEENLSNEELRRKQSQLLSRIPTSVWQESTQLFQSRGYTYQLNFSDPTNPKIILNSVRDIVSHKDIDATLCPGEKLYALLPNVRLAILNNLKQKISPTQYAQANYQASIVGKSDSVINIKSGEKKWAWVEYQNEGRDTWFNNSGDGIYLATSDIKNQIASIDSIRVASITSSDNTIIATTSRKEVRPGEVLRLGFQIEGPYNKQIESKNYLLTLKGKGWLPESEFIITLNVEDTGYQAEFVSQSNPIAVLSDSRFNVVIKHKNTGTEIWQKGKVKLNIFDINEQPSKFEDSSWPDENGLIDFEESSVSLDETATFKFKLQSHGAGLHRQLYYLSYQEGDEFVKIPSSQFDIITRVDAPYSAELISANIPAAVLNIWQPQASLTFKNTGSKTWDSQMVLRSYSEYTPYFKTSYFRDRGWDNTYAVDRVNNPVKPGETITFNFKIDAPSQPGAYQQIFQLEYGSAYEEIYIGNNKRVSFKTRVDKAN